MIFVLRFSHNGVSLFVSILHNLFSISSFHVKAHITLLFIISVAVQWPQDFTSRTLFAVCHFLVIYLSGFSFNIVSGVG